MIKIYCDKCGKEYEHRGETFHPDLCKECRDKFNEFQKKEYENYNKKIRDWFKDE